MYGRGQNIANRRIFFFDAQRSLTRSLRIGRREGAGPVAQILSRTSPNSCSHWPTRLKLYSQMWAGPQELLAHLTTKYSLNSWSSLASRALDTSRAWDVHVWIDAIQHIPYFMYRRPESSETPDRGIAGGFSVYLMRYSVETFYAVCLKSS